MNSETTKVLRYHCKRLGINYPINAAPLERFSYLVAKMESDLDTQAKNPTSSAKGMYQFIDGSIQPAINRVRRALGDAPWLASLEIHGDIRKFGPDKQTALFLGNILEMKGTDPAIMNIAMTGDVGVMKQLYAEKHHTKPDEATLTRMDLVFS